MPMHFMPVLKTLSWSFHVQSKHTGLGNTAPPSRWLPLHGSFPCKTDLQFIGPQLFPYFRCMHRFCKLTQHQQSSDVAIRKSSLSVYFL